MFMNKHKIQQQNLQKYIYYIYLKKIYQKNNNLFMYLNYKYIFNYLNTQILCHYRKLYLLFIYHK